MKYEYFFHSIIREKNEQYESLNKKTPVTYLTGEYFIYSKLQLCLG